jgi:hypothetical protein
VSIFFATPMYGAQCNAGFHKSAMASAIEMTKVGINFQWSTPFNESLITRARNRLVAEFLKTDLDYLFFIDADIEFDPKHIADLWNMQCPISCAAYPMKRDDAPSVVWKDGKIVDIKTFQKVMPIDFAGTGFMMISRKVIYSLQEQHPQLKYIDEYGNEIFALFDTAIEEDNYLPEDYFFCSLARRSGFPILLNPSVKLKHWGPKAYYKENDNGS